jgi:hypothetical protein
MQMQIPGLRVLQLSREARFMDGQKIKIPIAKLLFKMFDPFSQVHILSPSIICGFTDDHSRDTRKAGTTDPAFRPRSRLTGTVLAVRFFSAAIASSRQRLQLLFET